MKVEVTREVDNLSQSMHIDDDLTDIEVDEGMLHIYVNVGGDNSDNIGSVYFSKDELMKIYQKFQEVQAEIKTTAELDSSE